MVVICNVVWERVNYCEVEEGSVSSRVQWCRRRQDLYWGSRGALRRRRDQYYLGLCGACGWLCLVLSLGLHAVMYLHVVMTTATDLRMASPLPPLHSLSSTSKLDLNDRTLFAVFCFIKNFIGWVVQLSIHVQTLITDFDSLFCFLVYLKK